jgi:fructan beta-fructosidase
MKNNLRAKYHFSPEQNWMNDPNGLFYYDGIYHLSFQYNPYGNYWGNMSWGHAISYDLVHWTELDVVLYPDELGTIYSGNAVVDVNNTSGLKQNYHDPIIYIYTYCGKNGPNKNLKFTQGLSYSIDG